MAEMKSPYTGKVYRKKQAFEKHMDLFSKKEDSVQAKPQLSKDPKDPDELWLLEFFKDVKVETLAPSKDDIKKLADLYEKFQMKSAGNWVGCHNQRRHIMVTMYAFTNRRLSW